jgi:hypothetical protein
VKGFFFFLEVMLISWEKEKRKEKKRKGEEWF